MGEYGRLWKALEEDQGNEAGLDAIRFLALTGLRLREALRLQWDDVDIGGCRVRLKDSKTGPRNAPISKDAADLLAARRPACAAGYVFPSTKGGEIRDLCDPWHRACRRAGIEDARVHDLRHSYASQAVRAGVDLLVIRDLLGHASIATTQKYAHVADDHLREAASRITAGLPGSQDRNARSTSSSQSARSRSKPTAGSPSTPKRARKSGRSSST